MVHSAGVRKRRWLWHCRQNARQMRVEGVSRERRASKDWENDGSAKKEDYIEVQLCLHHPLTPPSCATSCNHTTGAPGDSEA